MPLTFLAHQVPVLPIRRRWPHLVDGTALVIGSMAPDLFFSLSGTGMVVDAHTPVGQVLYCLPLTVVLTILIKSVVAPVLVDVLPDRDALRWWDRRRLARWRVPATPAAWAVLVTSALIGSFSHLLLDAFTHSWGWGAELLGYASLTLGTAPEWLPNPIGGQPMAVPDVLQAVGSFVLILVAWTQLRLLGRDHRLADAARERDLPPVARVAPDHRAQALVVVTTAAGALAGFALGVVPHALTGQRQDLLFRVVELGFLGLVAGCALVTRRERAARRDTRAETAPTGARSLPRSPV